MGKLRVYYLKTLNKLSIYPLGNTPSAPSAMHSLRFSTWLWLIAILLSVYPPSPSVCHHALLPRVSRCPFAIPHDLLPPFPTTCHCTTKAPDTFYSPIWPHTTPCWDSGSSPASGAGRPPLELEGAIPWQVHTACILVAWPWLLYGSTMGWSSLIGSNSVTGLFGISQLGQQGNIMSIVSRT